jgi:hypothetical protein
MGADTTQPSAGDTPARRESTTSTLLNEARQAGTLGPAGMERLAKIVNAVRRRQDIPPPEGHEAWSPEADAEVAWDWVTEAALTGDLAVMLSTVTDDSSLMRFLHQCIANHFADQARATERGARARAIRRLAKAATDLTVLSRPVRYATNDCARLATYAGDPDRLHQVAATVPIGPAPRWDGERRAPIGSRTDVTAVLRAVLTEAGAPVLEQPTVVDVIAGRFNIQLHELPDVPYDDTTPPPQPAPASDGVDEATVDTLAVALWENLDDPARLVLGPHIDGFTVREIETMTGVRRSTVDRRTTLINTKIAQLLALSADSTAALSAVKERSYGLIGTVPTGSPSDQNVEPSS